MPGERKRRVNPARILRSKLKAIKIGGIEVAAKFHHRNHAPGIHRSPVGWDPEILTARFRAIGNITGFHVFSKKTLGSFR